MKTSTALNEEERKKLVNQLLDFNVPSTAERDPRTKRKKERKKDRQTEEEDEEQLNERHQKERNDDGGGSDGDGGNDNHGDVVDAVVS